MNDKEWLAAYNKGATDAKADIVEYLRLLVATGHKIADLREVSDRIDRGEFEG